MVGFQALQPIALLSACVCIRHPGAVVGKSEEVAFSREANWFDGANQVCVDQLVRLLCTPLWLPVVHFGGFGSLTAVTDVAIRVIAERDVEAVSKSLEKRKIGMP